MLGLILAALYVAFSLVAHDTQPVAAVESTLGFLWYWHVLLALVGLLVPLGGMVLASGSGTDRVAGLSLLAGSPVILLLLLLIPGLFLGGVYCVDNGIQSGEIVNQNHVVVGGILYGLGILVLLANRARSSNN
jgi:hypothetical protein